MMKVLGSSSSGFVGSKSFPPGFRFHPTDEELVMYYLKRKICRRTLKLDIIAETDVYKWDPDDLPGISKLKTGDRQWFFFSPRDRKYPNGGRSNRATMHGYWKATGNDRAISCNSRTVGLKKTLVYYKGRAPSGERTDWVMHEYALDEEELKRCLSAQDYYLLYKLYKKSGPGPKNGEQYGAPFKEEEWSDDECVNFSVPVDLEKTVQEADVSLIDNDKSNAQPQCWLNDLEEFLNRIADEPVNVPPLAVDLTFTLDQLIGDEENVSTLVDHSSREVNIPDRSMVNFEQAPSQLRLYEASEVTPASNISGQRLGGDNLVGDFLEMNDLLDPAPTVQNEAPAFDEIDGLPENDLYNDAAMFLRDMGPDELGQISQPYFMNNNFEGGMVNMDSHSYLNNIENEPVNSQMQPYLLNDANSWTWTNDQRFSILTPAENQSAISSQPNSGVVCNGNAANLPTGAAHSQNVNEDNGTDSWFSSVLWTFVESIPTAPASASENCLVNRSFDRMSSFGKVTANLIKNNDATGNQAATSRRFTGSKGGIFGFSILGIFFAILWVLIDLP